MRFKEATQSVINSIKQLDRTDLRKTHFAILGMIIVVPIINYFLPHSWTLWPLVMAGALMSVINEAAERHGHGIPPLHVYGFFIGSVLCFFAVVMVMSTVPPLVWLAVIITLGYFAAKAWLQKKFHEEMVARRIMDGLCVHCGEPASTDMDLCEHCGLEPNPTTSQARRVLDSAHRHSNPTHTRSILKQESTAVSASRKEQALIANRRAGKKPSR